MKKKALVMVLSDKAKNGGLIILDKIELPEVKTKKANEIFNNLDEKVLQNKDKEKKTKRNFLVLVNKSDDKLKRAINNLANVEAVNLENINIIDLLRYRNLILTAQGVEFLEKIYAKK